jgi:hypothetical protein
VNTPEEFRNIVARLGKVNSAFVLAELNDLLTAADANQFRLLAYPEVQDAYFANYVAAMVELAAHRRGVHPPAWTSDITPLPEPVFAVSWPSLRAHLLLESPVPFRRRNIFIDSSIGARL